MLKELRIANVTRQLEWTGNDKCDVAFRAIEVAGEAGELSEAVKKWLRAERGATIGDIAAEMADVIISIDLLANELGINLPEAVAGKFNATSEKYGFETRLK